MKNNKVIKLTIEILIAAIVIVVVVATVFMLKENANKSSEVAYSESTQESKLTIKFLYESTDYWQKFDMSNAGYKTQAEYETAVLNYIDQITKLLSKEDWYKQYTNNNNIIYIKLVLTEKEIKETINFPKNTDSDNITFNINYPIGMISYCDLPLVNSLTHIITYNKLTGVSSFSKTLDDGICEYLQNHYYSGKGVMICDRPAQEVKERNYDVIDVHKVVKLEQSHNKLPFEKLETDNSGFAIRYRYSFVDYLIQTYGLEAVLKVHDGKDESAYNSLSKNGFSGLISDWKQFLSKYPDFTSSEAQIESEAWESHEYLYRNYYDFKY